MLLPVLAILVGLAVLVWSADHFVDGASATARHLGVPPLVIGMIIVGFGTSAPELIVSFMAALDHTPGLALGNAYGSNIANIGLILGLTAVIAPLDVRSEVLRRELPVLAAATALTVALLWDGHLSRLDAAILLLTFAGVMGASVVAALRNRGDALASETEAALAAEAMPLPRAMGRTILGLAMLIVSSRALVWGAVEIARALGVSDLIVGLTVVAVGTSLPELASSVVAVRKGEDDIALGNVIGSNLFNTLAVVGLAAAVAPIDSTPEILRRDVPVMAAFTVSLFLLARGRPASIGRWAGIGLMVSFAIYTAVLIVSAFGSAQS